MKCYVLITLLSIFLLIELIDAKDIPWTFSTANPSLENLTSDQLVQISLASPELNGVPPISLDRGNNLTANVTIYRNDIRSKLDMKSDIVFNESRRLARKYPGERTIDQICEIHNYLLRGDETTNGWCYLSDQHGSETIQFANQTLLLGKDGNFSGVGDCDDFAILLASLIEFIGGTTRIIIDEKNKMFIHAYTQVYLGQIGSHEDHVEDVMLYLIQKYNIDKVYVYIDTETKDVWLNLDWQYNENDVVYPGNPFLKADRSLPIYVNGPSPKTSINVKSIERTFGGTDFDRGNSVKVTEDDGNIIAGNTFSYGAGSSDIWVIKTNSRGYKEWDKTYGGLEGDGGIFIQKSLDGGYLVTGFRNESYSIPSDIFLMKIGREGNIMWENTFGSGEGRAIQITNDNEYIILGVAPNYGSNNHDTCLIKVDSNGTELWTKIFGGDNDYEGKCIEIANGGGYLVVGSSKSSGSWDIWLLRVDSGGNELWNKTFGKSSSEVGKCIIQTSDGDYIIIGKKAYNAYLVKVDSHGNMIWEKNLPGNSEANSIIQTNDGGYILVGKINNIFNQDNLWVTKIDNDGRVLWDKNYGGPGFEEGMSIDAASFGGYVITGYLDSEGVGGDCWLMKIDENGNKMW